MKIKDAEAIGERVVEWCAKQFGNSKYHYELPFVLASYVGHPNPKMYGEYDVDEIAILVYTRMNRTVKDLVNTVIHEYTHHMQHPAWIARHIAKYGLGQKSSRKNPYELKAEATAFLYTRKCMEELKLH